MKTINFEKAFSYPFAKSSRLLNFLWVLLPLIGWFALYGYTVRIIKGFTEQKFKQMPALELGEDISLGFFMFLKSIPGFLVIWAALFLTTLIPFIGIPLYIIAIIMMPLLIVHFIVKQTVVSLMEYSELKVIFSDFADYLIALIKGILAGMIYLVIMGIPVGLVVLLGFVMKINFWTVLLLIALGIPATMIAFMCFAASGVTKNLFIADFYGRNNLASRVVKSAPKKLVPVKKTVVPVKKMVAKKPVVKKKVVVKKKSVAKKVTKKPATKKLATKKTVAKKATKKPKRK